MAVAHDGRREEAINVLANAALCWPLAMSTDIGDFDLLEAPPEHDELAMQHAVDALRDKELDAVIGGLRELEARLDREAQRRRLAGSAQLFDDAQQRVDSVTRISGHALGDRSSVIEEVRPPAPETPEPKPDLSNYPRDGGSALMLGVVLVLALVAAVVLFLFGVGVL